MNSSGTLLALAASVCAAFLLGSCDDDGTDPAAAGSSSASTPASTAASTPASPPATSTTTADPGVFGPRGFDGIELGDSVAQVRAAGGRTMHGTCSFLVLPSYEVQPTHTDGYVSDDGGVQAIFAPPGVRTAEGIGIGSTEAEVVAAYPAIGPRRHGYRVLDVDEGVQYQFGFDEHHRVVELNTGFTPHPCFG